MAGLVASSYPARDDLPLVREDGPPVARGLGVFGAQIDGLAVGDTCFALGTVTGKVWFRARLLRVRATYPQFFVEYIADLTGNSSALALPTPRRNFVPAEEMSAQEPQAESTSTGRKRSRSAKAAEAEGVEAAPPPNEGAAAAAAKAAAGGAGATTVVGKGPSWHWLSSKHHRGGVHAFATRSTRVGLAKYQAEVPHAVEAAAPPPAPPPRCRCGQPCVWDRRRWWCALADSADGGCGHEEAVPPVPLCPVCLCGERTVWLRERWWCARAVGGCGFEEEPDTDRDASEYARDAPRRIDNREIERQQAVRTAALLTAAAYSGTSWVYGAPGVMSASDRVQLLETDADVAHRTDRGGSDGADAAAARRPPRRRSRAARASRETLPRSASPTLAVAAVRRASVPASARPTAASTGRRWREG